MTKRVLLLLTGDCERGGFPSALTAEFAPRADVTFDAYGDVFHSATSASVGIDRLAGQPSASGRGPVDKLASALIDAGLRCDLAIAIDDLELVNAGRADSVKAFFGAAVARETQRLGLTHPQVQRIAQRCSFHLLAPMVEAYFFGEHAAIDRALATAGAPTGLLWSTSGSLEDFTTLDAAYCDREFAPDLARSDRKDDKTLAWRAGNREKHPKHYLEFLCRSAPQGYREGKAGVAALEALALQRVTTCGTPLLADLLGDIEDALNLPRILGAGAAHLTAGVPRNV